MRQFKERRKHIRRSGDGLVVLIDGRVYPIIDISVSGVSFQCSHLSPGEDITLKLAKMMKLDEAVEGRIIVKGTRETTTTAEFIPSYRLMRFIIRHISSLSGVTPLYF